MIQGTGNVADPDLAHAPFRVVLYRLHHGAVENSNAEANEGESTFSTVSTVPHRTKTELLLASEPTANERAGSRAGKKKVHAFPVAVPMPSIPEMEVDSPANEREGVEEASARAGAAPEEGEEPNEMDDHLLPWEQDRNEEDRDASLCAR